MLSEECTELQSELDPRREVEMEITLVRTKTVTTRRKIKVFAYPDWDYRGREFSVSDTEVLADAMEVAKNDPEQFFFKDAHEIVEHEEEEDQVSYFTSGKITAVRPREDQE